MYNCLFFVFSVFYCFVGWLDGFFVGFLKCLQVDLDLTQFQYCFTNFFSFYSQSFLLITVLNSEFTSLLHIRIHIHRSGPFMVIVWVFN